MKRRKLSPDEPSNDQQQEQQQVQELLFGRVRKLAQTRKRRVPLSFVTTSSPKDEGSVMASTLIKAPIRAIIP